MYSEILYCPVLWSDKHKILVWDEVLISDQMCIKPQLVIFGYEVDHSPVVSDSIKA